MTGTEVLIFVLTVAVGLVGYLAKVSYDLHKPDRLYPKRRR